jgi:hypothetical protein
MKPHKWLFPGITILILFSMLADLYVLPQKSEKAAVYDFEVRSGRRHSGQTYYVIPRAQHEFSVLYNCYDYLKEGDEITIYNSLLFSKTLTVSFEREGRRLYFRAGMSNVFLFPYLIGFNFLSLAAGMILWLIKKFNYQKERLLGMSFFFSLILLLFYYLVY